MATKKTNVTKKSPAKKSPAKVEATVKRTAAASKSANPAPATEAASVIVDAELASLGKAALQKKFREVFGRAPKSDNVDHIRKALAKKLVPKPAEAKPTLPEGPARPTKERDSRLPVIGTVIKRDYKGSAHEVKVLEDAFEYGGARHSSLSAIAKAITGQQTNGFLWFGLIPRKANKPEDRTPAQPSDESRPVKRASARTARQ